ncbi:MAG: hypothetical protein NC452_02280 [Eubacterium sp.]|nr:hypothetical protein [Eubacterium sp.]
MYEIIIDGRLSALCEKPRYVKIKEDTGAYVESSHEEAIGIAVNSEVYNIDDRNDIPDMPQAIVKECSASEFIFSQGVKISENEKNTGSAFIDVESAVCELDTTTSERFNEVETALCEIDAKINGKGE